MDQIHLIHHPFITDVKLEYQITPKKEPMPLKIEFNDIEPTLQKVYPQVEDRQMKMTRHQNKLTRKTKRPWTKDQDQLLRKLVESKGAKQWASISTFFLERCGKQCRQRWHNHLRNGIRKDQWSQDEEMILFLGVRAYGKKWSIISRMLEGRTQNTLKNHWNCKMKPKIDRLQQNMIFLIQQYPNVPQTITIVQKNLLKMITTKMPIVSQPSHEQLLDRDRVVELLKNSLSQFYQMKRQIYGLYDMDVSSEIEVKQCKKYEMRSFESFGKNKNIERSTCQKRSGKSRSRREKTENPEIKLQEDPEYLCREFDSKLTPYESQNDESESPMELTQKSEEIHVKEEEMDCEDDSSILEENSEQEQSQEDYKYDVIDFCSPLKPQAFERIDLGESNEKKKLFS